VAQRESARNAFRRDEPPRLILRFAISTCVALAIAAGAILLVVRYYNTVQAERAATSQARVVASTLLRGALHASDFEQRVDAGRRAELDRLFATALLDQGFLRAELHAEDGRVTYGTDRRISTPTDAAQHVREARAGLIRGDVTTIRHGGDERRVLRTYAPIPLPGKTGVVALFQDYEPVAAAATATFLPVVGILEAVLLALFVALVPILRRVMRRLRRQMEEIEYRALYDELTGLPNRALVRDLIDDAVAVGSAAVLLFDLDRFKEINDALGHETGDLLLREVAARLGRELVEGASLGRLGGDEFAIVLPDAIVADAVALAARVHAALELPFALRGLPLEVATSVGVAHFPEHGNDAETLLQRADVAMYLAKEAHAGTAVYNEEQDANDAERLALAGELRRGIEEEQLLLHFQPKADLATGRVVGVEALVRWDHPERGVVPPNEFIPIAERTGLIKPLTRYVVAAALRQCREWNDGGGDLHVSVNLTVPDLLDLELPDYIAGLLAETGVPPHQLEFELTESTILADPFRVRQVLARFDEMGIGLAIDDFGTGYSSFAYLKRLPVRTIKVDRSFVMGMCEDESDATIVRSTVDLAQNLGLDVVAEGVESQEIWAALAALGCTLAQGYFISRPVSAEELVRVLAEWVPPAEQAPPRPAGRASSRRAEHAATRAAVPTGAGFASLADAALDPQVAG
jgi:diguanylate cyclase (GGDEF)-like protein